MAAQSDSARGRPTAVAPVASAPAAPPVLVVRRPPLWRRLLAWALLILFCLAAPLALLAGWGRWAVSDPDRYAATVRSAAADPSLQAALARAVTDRLGDLPPTGATTTTAAPVRFAMAAVQADPPAPPPAVTATAIPPERAVRRAAPLASPPPRLASAPAATSAAPPPPSPPPPPATTDRSTRAPSAASPAAAEAVAVAAATPAASGGAAPGSPDAAARYFGSPEFVDAWNETNRGAYAALRDASPPAPLALDLSPVLPGLAAAIGAPPPAASASSLRFALLDAAATDRLRGALDRLDWLSVVLPTAAALLFVGTFWAGPGKLRWLRRLGLGLALSMVVLLLVLLLGAPIATGRAGGPPAAEVVRALLDALLWWPVLLAAALVAVGLGVAVVAGLLGWLIGGRRARTHA